MQQIFKYSRAKLESNAGSSVNKVNFELPDVPEFDFTNNNNQLTTDKILVKLTGLIINIENSTYIDKPKLNNLIYALIILN
jgi:hypothetical protein